MSRFAVGFAMALCAALCAPAASRAAGAAPFPPRVRAQIAPLRPLVARGSLDSATLALDAIAERARLLGDDTLFLAARFEAGATLAWAGRLVAAVPRLRDAVARARVMRDSLHEVAATQWLAHALVETGRRPEGLRLAQSALPTARALGDDANAGYLQMILAADRLRSGRAAAALRDYRRSLRHFERTTDVHGTCEAMLGLGRAWMGVGRQDSATALWMDTVRRAEAARLPRQAAAAINNVAARASEAGDIEDAVSGWRRAIELFHRGGDLAGAATAAGNLALALVALGREAEAEALADTLARRMRGAGRPDLERGLVLKRAWIAYQRGRLGEASTLFRGALAGSIEAPSDQVLDALTGSVRCAVDRGEAAAALQLCDSLVRAAALHFSPRERALVDAVRTRAAWAAGDYDEAERSLHAASAGLPLHGMPGVQGDLHRLEALLRARRGDRRGALGSLRRAEVAWSHDSEKARDLESRTALSPMPELGAAWMQVLLGHGGRPDRATIGLAFDAIERLRAASLPRQADPAGPGASRPVVVPLEVMQRRVLQPGELLLAAWVTREGGWLFAVTRDTATVVDLPARAELGRDVDVLRSALTADPTLPAETLGRLLASAYGAWFSRIEPLLTPARRVMIVPHGSLQIFPVEVLRTAASGPWLEADRTVSRLPSASFLASARGRRTSPAGVVAVASSESPGGGGLTGAVAEVRDLAARYEGVTVIERPSTREALLARMQQAGLLHVATHSAFDEELPWRSTLWLGPAGALTARQVLARRWRSDLVILTGCQTAGGRRTSGGGMEGLSAAFLLGGARAVVATLWPVSDRAARRFVECFYEEMSRGADAGQAVARARSRLRADPAGASPRDWAAFTVVGDPTARVPLEARRRAWPAR